MARSLAHSLLSDLPSPYTKGWAMSPSAEHSLEPLKSPHRVQGDIHAENAPAWTACVFFKRAL